MSILTPILRTTFAKRAAELEAAPVHRTLERATQLSFRLLVNGAEVAL